VLGLPKNMKQVYNGCMRVLKNIIRFVVVTILTWEARLVLRKYKPKIIAITGSVGKTSTKDAIYAGLKDLLHIRKSKKSFNSDIGVPLTVLGCDTGWRNPLHWCANILEGMRLILTPNHYPKWLVLEIGADAPGDIRRITRWVKPDIAVITALPDIPVHVENFPDTKAVIEEKLLLARALKPDGVLILNGDDVNIRKMTEQFTDSYILTYGTEPHNDVAAVNISISYEAGHIVGMHFNVVEKGSSMPMRIFGRIGTQQVYPIVAAFAVARVLGLPPTTVSKSIQSEKGSLGRMRILQGAHDTTIIDDTYNSSPTALRAALATLKKIETTGKKIAILGDMLELGTFSKEAHRSIGTYVAGIVDELVTVGSYSVDIAQAAKEAGLGAGHIRTFPRGAASDAGRFVRGMLQAGDVILAKGSQSGIRLERAVRELLADPLEAKEVLVRQDDEWIVRR